MTEYIAPLPEKEPLGLSKEEFKTAIVREFELDCEKSILEYLLQKLDSSKGLIENSSDKVH